MRAKTTGTIHIMSKGVAETVKNDILSGLGTIIVVVTVGCDEGAFNQQAMKGFQLFCITKL